ncbi:MAG TPA: SDR family oxidoreductase [Candidatus Cybelea sp.]|nr:SDR family oxidoreductase [Candidatus Cybelea sp.]
MRIFVTGASGFIGSALIPELTGAGHHVLGLSRSDSSAKAIAAAGAEVHRGSLEDRDSLKAGVAAADGVIHLGFNHDFSKWEANCEDDRQVIDVLAAQLAGSERPLVVTGGIGTQTPPGQVATEQDPALPSSVLPRTASEEAALAAAEQGVRASVMRLPQVHDRDKQGLITMLIPIASEKRVSAYLGEGTNRWPAVHVLDAARLYRLAIEEGARGIRYHAVAEEGVEFREIAMAIGERIGVPTASISENEAADHFGWLARFVSLDMPASSALTQKLLGWVPSHTGLIADLRSAAVAGASRR